jgi:hypothetical protein
MVVMAPRSESDVRRIAAVLRSRFRNRAARVLLKAKDDDPAPLRADDRWASLVSSAVSGSASSDVEGYLPEKHLRKVSRSYLLVAGERDPNVIVHVLPAGQPAYPESDLRLAADLADHRSPREELRAVEILRDLAELWRNCPGGGNG